MARRLIQCERRARNTGFTLIEVLVTITLLSVIATMAWKGLDGMLHARTISESKLDAVLRLDTVVAQVESDLAALHNTEIVPPLQFDGATLRMTRRDTAGTRVVAWTLRAGKWYRWTSDPLLQSAALNEAWIRSQQLGGQEAGTAEALPGLTGLQVYFWRNNAWSNPQSSNDKADSDGIADVLPEGVRLVLELDSSAGLSGRVSRDLRLPSRL